MNKRVMDMLIDRMDGRRSRRDYERDRRDYEDGRDYEDERDYEDSRDYEDGRRGVRGSGRGRGRGRSRRDYADERDYGEHGRSKLRLTRKDMHEWKQMMENADGSRGAHYDMEKIMSVADRIGVKFEGYNEAEFCLVTNVMYSDYCKTLKKYVGTEKLLECCAELARDFLEDEDGPEPSDKVMLYYHCIVNA